jgi:hypothetical protein
LRFKGAVALIQPGSDAGHVPWQQRVDPFDRIVSDPIMNLAQVVLGIEAVQFGGLCRAPNYAERLIFPGKCRDLDMIGVS